MSLAASRQHLESDPGPAAATFLKPRATMEAAASTTGRTEIMSATYRDKINDILIFMHDKTCLQLTAFICLPTYWSLWYGLHLLSSLALWLPLLCQSSLLYPEFWTMWARSILMETYQTNIRQKWTEMSACGSYIQHNICLRRVRNEEHIKREEKAHRFQWKHQAQHVLDNSTFWYCANFA